MTVAAALACCAMHASSALAQDAAQKSLLSPETEADALFARLLVKPDDLDATFRYSSLQAQLGDQEAAIGGLERMLFYNPDLPRVRLELGLLYFRLGSYEMARANFEAAIAGKNVPEDVVIRVRGFLKEIDRRVADHQFSFFGTAGFRHQSNANGGPDSQIVRALGNDAVLSSQFRRRPDTNAFGSAQMRHVYDFENQRGDSWETNATAYYAKQFHVRRYDLGVAQVDTGPRLTISNAAGLSFRPYATAAFLPLGGRPYLASPGAGASVRWLDLNGAMIEPGLEINSRRFYNSSNFPNATNQNGSLLTTYVNAGAPLPMTVYWRAQARFYYSAAYARYRPYSYNQVGLDASLAHDFEPLVKVPTDRRWTGTLFAGWSDTKYRAIDTIVDPTFTRHDRLIRFGAALDMPIYEGFGIAAQASYTINRSTLANFRNRNFAISLAPTYRF